jgi:hypothetical protein
MHVPTESVRKMEKVFFLLGGNFTTRAADGNNPCLVTILLLCWGAVANIDIEWH